MSPHVRGPKGLPAAGTGLGRPARRHLTGHHAHHGRPGPTGDWWLKHVAPGQAWHINSSSPHAPRPTALVGLPNEPVFPGPFDLPFNGQSLPRSPAMPPRPLAHTGLLVWIRAPTTPADRVLCGSQPDRGSRGRPWGMLGGMCPGLAVQSHLGTFQAPCWGERAARRKEQPPFHPPGAGSRCLLSEAQKVGPGLGLTLSARPGEKTLRAAGGHL